MTAVALFALPSLAAPPRVVEAAPDHADVAVDPELREIRIRFDQEMMTDRWSICGGGPTFPEVTARPRWTDARTLVLPVTLEPGRRYELSVNCPSAQNTRSRAGVPAESYPITFVTAREGEAAPALTPERAQEMTEALREAIDKWYSHRDARGVDWEARFAEMSDLFDGAPTPAAFARAAAELLRANDDLHVVVEVNDIRLATGRRIVTPNVDPQALARSVPEWREFPGGAEGRFRDGICYIAINGWPGGDETSRHVLAAIARMPDAPALVIDVRLNAGGDELMARRVAACFVEERHVYSRNTTRSPSAPDGWAGPFDRAVEPAPEGPHFRGRVAVLMGPACMSTTESFVLMMRRPGKRELFGERTWGSSGNPRPHDIGEGVRIYLSSWRDTTPDGQPIEGAGIEPDHKVEWTADGEDQVLTAALKWLRNAAAEEAQPPDPG